jgi:hypothetical protein
MHTGTFPMKGLLSSQQLAKLNQSALWTDLYVTCLLNRTMAVRHCPNGQVFDPNQLHCVSKIPKGQ